MNISVIDAIGVCIFAMNLGQTKGAYTLDYAEKVYVCSQILTNFQQSLVKKETPDIKDLIKAYEFSKTAIELAQSKGAYMLQDVPKITSSIKSLDSAKENVLIGK